MAAPPLGSHGTQPPSHGSLAEVRHRDCGGDPRIHLQCDRCGEEVGPREAEAKPGPGLKAA